jgi:hypothetical protein
MGCTAAKMEMDSLSSANNNLHLSPKYSTSEVEILQILLLLYFYSIEEIK